MGTYAFDKDHTKVFTFKFNVRTDNDIIDRLQSIGNKQGYIKALIRADIASHAGDEPPTTAGGRNIVGGEINRNKQSPQCGVAPIEVADGEKKEGS